jgi:hypothetical protein
MVAIMIRPSDSQCFHAASSKGQLARRLPRGTGEKMSEPITFIRMLSKGHEGSFRSIATRFWTRRAPSQGTTATYTSYLSKPAGRDAMHIVAWRLPPQSPDRIPTLSSAKLVCRKATGEVTARCDTLHRIQDRGRAPATRPPASNRVPPYRLTNCDTSRSRSCPSHPHWQLTCPTRA